MTPAPAPAAAPAPAPTTADTHTLYKELRGSDFTEQQADVLVKHEVARKEGMLTSKDGQMIIERMNVMEASMGARIDAMEARAEAREERMGARMDVMEARAAARAEAMESRVEAMEARAEAREERMGARMDVMEARAEAMESRLKADIADNKKSVYQAVAIGVGIILTAIGVAAPAIAFLIGKLTFVLPG